MSIDLISATKAQITETIAEALGETKPAVAKVVAECLIPPDPIGFAQTAPHKFTVTFPADRKGQICDLPWSFSKAVRNMMFSGAKTNVASTMTMETDPAHHAISFPKGITLTQSVAGQVLKLVPQSLQLQGDGKIKLSAVDASGEWPYEFDSLASFQEVISHIKWQR